MVACINGQSAGNVTQLLLRGIIWNYSQVKEIRLVTEMPQIENQNVFRPFPSYDVLRSWFNGKVNEAHFLSANLIIYYSDIRNENK